LTANSQRGAKKTPRQTRIVPTLRLPMLTPADAVCVSLHASGLPPLRKPPV